MASSVATATSSPFLLTTTARAPAPPQTTAVVEPQSAPAPDPIAAGQAALGSTTSVLRGVAAGGVDVAVFNASRSAVQVALAGAVATLSERLRTTEEGTAACELLGAVTSAYEALAVANGATVIAGH